MVAATDGESRWEETEHLLAAIADALNVANWQRANRKTARRPKPVPRPGARDPNTETFGGSYSEDEIRAFLDGTDGRQWVPA